MLKRLSYKRLGDTGTPERHARGELRKEVINDTLIAATCFKTAFHTLYRRRVLDENQFLSADKLRAHWEIGQGRKSCEYRERTSGGNMSETEAQIIYKDLYLKALKALNNAEIALVIHVVINDRPPTRTGMSGSLQRKKMRELRGGLDKLAKHYHFC